MCSAAEVLQIASPMSSSGKLLDNDQTHYRKSLPPIRRKFFKVGFNRFRTALHRKHNYLRFSSRKNIVFSQASRVSSEAAHNSLPTPTVTRISASSLVKCISKCVTFLFA